MQRHGNQYLPLDGDFERCSNARQVAKGMADGMLFDEILGGEGRVPVQRDRSGIVELFIAQFPNSGDCLRAVARQELQCCFLHATGVCLRVLRVQLVTMAQVIPVMA